MRSEQKKMEILKEDVSASAIGYLMRCSRGKTFALKPDVHGLRDLNLATEPTLRMLLFKLSDKKKKEKRFLN